MSALNRKLLRDLHCNWPMLLAVCAIIAVGIGCFVGMMSAARNLEFARTGYYSRCRLADFWIDLKKTPLEDVKRQALIPGISEIRTRIQFRVVLDFPGLEKPVSSLLLSLPDEPSPVINNIILRTGTYFTPGRPNEVIVSEKFARARNIVPGSKITAVLNNQRKELIVTGTAISAEFVYMTSPGSMVDEPGSYGLMYVKRSFAEDTFGFQNACNSIVGFLAPQVKKNAKQLINELTNRLSPYGVFVGVPRSEQFSPMVLNSEMGQLRKMAYIFPVFFLIVAALVLNVLMTRLAEQQRTVIGTLKAIGYGNQSLILHFMKFAATCGLAGGVLGCLLGSWIGTATTVMYTAYFTFPKLTSNIYLNLFFFGIFISVLFAVLGTVKGVYRIMSLEPAESMRQASPPVGKIVFLERFPLFWKNLDAQWQMIFRSLSRNKTRALIAVFSAAMGSSIVVLAFGFVDSMDLMINLQFNKSLKSNYNITFNKELPLSALDGIKQLPGVTCAEPVLNLSCNFIAQNRSKRGVIIGIADKSSLTIPLDKNNNPVSIPLSGLVMSRRLMDKLGIRAGDYLDVVPVKGVKRTLRLPVMMGIESMLGLMVYADLRWLNSVLNAQGVINEIRLKTRHNSLQKKQFMAALKTLPSLETLTDIKEQKEALNAQLNNAMRAMAVIMILFAAIIFFGAILNGTLISIAERRRETATFRTMGYFDFEIGRLFLRENMLTNISGTLLGLPLGKKMLDASMQGFASDAYSFPVYLSYASYAWTVMLALSFVLISQILVRRSLKKQNWLEALNIKE